MRAVSCLAGGGSSGQSYSPVTSLGPVTWVFLALLSLGWVSLGLPLLSCHLGLVGSSSLLSLGWVFLCCPVCLSQARDVISQESFKCEAEMCDTRQGESEVSQSIPVSSWVCAGHVVVC